MVIVGAAEEDMIPVSAVASLHAIAESLRHSLQGMERWGIHELTLGLYKVSLKHSNTKSVDTIEGEKVTSRHELESLIQWLQWARAAYKRSAHEMAEALDISTQDIVLHETVAAIHQPSYYVALDAARKHIVVGVRGTQDASDVLTDLTPHSEAFERGFAHSGMLRSARWILKKELGNLCSLIKSNPGFEVVTVGHSLGAGTAALLCLLLREAARQLPEHLADVHAGPTLARARCWAYACPPCLSRDLAAQTPFITTVVLQDDVVARASPASLEELRAEILQTDWYQALPDGCTSKQVFQVYRSTSAHVEAALGMQKGALLSHATSMGQALITSTINAAHAKVVAGSGTKAVGAASSTSSASSSLWGTLAAVAATAVSGPATTARPPTTGKEGAGPAQRGAAEKPPRGAQSSSTSSSFSWLATGTTALAGAVAQMASSMPEDRRDSANVGRRSSSFSSSSSSSSSPSPWLSSSAWLQEEGNPRGGGSGTAPAPSKGQALLRTLSGALAAVSVDSTSTSSSSSSGGVGASASASPSASAPGTGAGASKQGVEAQRLFAPGLLFHLLRTELPPDSHGDIRVPKKTPSISSLSSLSSLLSSSSSVNKAPSNERQDQLVEYKVMKGSNPNSRFQRMILSNTMLSDHNTKAYMEAMLDVLQRLP